MSGKGLAPAEELSEFLLYNTDGGNTRVQVRLYEGSVWLSQRLIADLYDRSPKTVSEHIANIFEEGELEPERVTRVFDVEQDEGGRSVVRSIVCYNLEMILAVGYRARSARGTQFRKWATKLLQEYVVKGFVLDDERLKEPAGFGQDYFDELLERIRAIRASEKRLYLKVRDIYALSVDYDKNHPAAKKFFAAVQNKIHFAVHGHTAAEIMVLRVNADLPHMGLSTWKESPNGKIHLADVLTAKNYLSSEEITTMNSLVNQFLEYAEQQARSRKVMTMHDWEVKLEAILRLNDMSILTSAGKVSMERAKSKASREFEVFEARELERETAQDEDELEDVLKKLVYIPKSDSSKDSECNENR